MNENPSRSEDRFENGYFWELYLDLERQFRDFIEYVPYLDSNEHVVSYRLLNLILGIGGHIDSAFKEMARYQGFSKNEDCLKILERLGRSETNIRQGKPPIPIPIGLPLKAFEREYELSQRTVVFKRFPRREQVSPFKPSNPRTNAPEWWEIYNGLKHDVSVTFEKANLRIARDALAGAFILNVIHEPAYLKMFEQGILRRSLYGAPAIFEVKPDYKNKLIDWRRTRKKMWGFVETPLFFYDHTQYGGKNE